MELDDDRELRGIILGRIREKGRITFEEYMRTCLYEPGLGYYTSPGTRIGADGDFYTSINVHRVFGRVIAREIVRMWECMDSPSSFAIVEAGAGNGRLARDVLDAICSFSPRLYAGLCYLLVEAEPSLRGVQRAMLSGHGEMIAWGSADELAAGRLSCNGCIVSNELVDSFPVHLVEMTAEGLMEVHVTAEGDGFAEILVRPSTPLLEERLARLGVTLLPGQRGEINLAAERWLTGVASSLERGFVLTVDYGYPAAELYAPFRSHGTLLCYHRHRVEEDPFVRVGRQDITSHVDFTSLMVVGGELGLATVWFGEQYRFLMEAGIMDELAEMEAQAASDEERQKGRLLLKKLILPDGGMGDTFKVLIQAKGVPEPERLCAMHRALHL